MKFALYLSIRAFFLPNTSTLNDSKKEKSFVLVLHIRYYVWYYLCKPKISALLD